MSNLMEQAARVGSILIVDRQDCQLGWVRDQKDCVHVILHPVTGLWTELPMTWQPASDPDGDGWFECSTR